MISSSLLKTISFAGVALFIAFFLWAFSPDENISLKIFVPTVAILVIIIVALLYALKEVFKTFTYLPKVILGKKYSKGVGKYKLLCLLEPSDIFSYDTLVSFFIKEENFEQFIGIGKVLNIQDDGKIQVVMTDEIGGFEDIIKKIKNNDNEILKKLKIKPNIPSSYLPIPPTIFMSYNMRHRNMRGRLP